MSGLDTGDPSYTGNFRGDPSVPALADYEVVVGPKPGVAAQRVAAALEAFESKLRRAVAALDRRVPPGVVPDEDTLPAVVDLCGWAHAEWVRIHPFANGNGRTARLLANHLAMRYRLPPFLRLRPRPEGDAYASAASAAMDGDPRPTIALFHEMVRRHLEGRN